MSDPFDWDKAFEEVAERNRKAFDKEDTSQAREARLRKQREEHERGVRLGWWDNEGNPLHVEENEEENDEDDEA
jgi:hypothetical protein